MSCWHADPNFSHACPAQSHPKFKSVADVAPLLYSRALQVRAGWPVDAVVELHA